MNELAHHNLGVLINRLRERYKAEIKRIEGEIKELKVACFDLSEKERNSKRKTKSQKTG